MPINLNNVKISLDKFNDAASGNFNIGQIKLNSDGTSVYRTNKHKTLTILNYTKIRPEESLAVKNAFCDALRREGLNAETVAAIREKLGIRGSILDILKAGNIKPLSAAEVREIIDEYAGQINKKRASKPDVAALKTSSDLYQGVSKETLATRRTTGDEITARSTAKMKTSVGGTLNQFLDILQFSEKPVNLTLDTKALAYATLRKLRSPSALSQPNVPMSLGNIAPITLKCNYGGTVIAKFELDNGNTFSVSTNMSKNDLLKHLETLMKQTGVIEDSDETSEIQEETPEIKQNKSYTKEIDDLKRTFDIVKNPGEMNRRKEAILRTLPTKNAIREFTQEELRVQASIKLREMLTDPLLDELVVALREVRGVDLRNTQLLNNVREVIAGNQSIDADALVKEISDILSKAPKDSNPQIGASEQIDDDLDKPLNINELLGN